MLCRSHFHTIMPDLSDPSACWLKTHLSGVTNRVRTSSDKSSKTSAGGRRARAIERERASLVIAGVLVRAATTSTPELGQTGRTTCLTQTQVISRILSCAEDTLQLKHSPTQPNVGLACAWQRFRERPSGPPCPCPRPLGPPWSNKTRKIWCTTSWSGLRLSSED
jgi:hypothetical protein